MPQIGYIMNPIIGISDVLTAFNDSTIGSKVISKKRFLSDLSEEIAKVDFDSFQIPGQAYIKLPDHFCSYVSAGIGRRTTSPDDYVVRMHREKVGLYLKREFAAGVDGVAVVVYTKEAYLDDPDVNEKEAEWVKARGYTHMLVAVLASSGPPSPLTPNRFIHNLAGGNNEALQWTADEIRAKAVEIANYSNEFCVVAD
jgi:hypothetical protein